MNGKKAKELRKLAREMTIGKKLVDYEGAELSHQPFKKGPGHITVRVAPETTRGVYLFLKKQAKRSSHVIHRT